MRKSEKNALIPATYYTQQNIKKVIARLDKRNRMRDNTAHEMLTSEKSYVAGLEELVKLYLHPLKNLVGTSSKILSEEAIQTIFGNVEEIITIGKKMVELFEANINTWEEKHTIADAFFFLTPQLDIFSSYCAGYGPALICLNEKLSSEKFAAFLEAQTQLGMYTKLPDYLILPVQRIPRYRMLLQSLLQYTCPSDPECEVIKKAIDSVAEVADSINQAIREHQELEELISIVRQIKNAPPTLVAPKRAFIKEGSLVKICRKSPKPRHFFLFSDCLVYTKRIEAVATMYMFHRMTMLKSTAVADKEDHGTTTNAFQILGKEKSFTLCAKDPEEKKEWMDAITQAIQKLGAATNAGQAPVWVPDRESKNCMLCGMKFTTFNRRHHCRRCGKCVCGKCSACKFLLDNVGDIERVCCPCFDYLVETHGGWSVVSKTPKQYELKQPVVSGCRVLIQPSQWTHKQVTEWLEQVNNGVFAELAKAEVVPENGNALIELNESGVNSLFEKSPLAKSDEKKELISRFNDELEKLRVLQKNMTPVEPEPQPVPVGKLSATKKFATSFRRLKGMMTGSGGNSSSSSELLSPSKTSSSSRPSSPHPGTNSSVAPVVPEQPEEHKQTPEVPKTACPRTPKPESTPTRPRAGPPARKAPVVPKDDDDEDNGDTKE